MKRLSLLTVLHVVAAAGAALASGLAFGGCVLKRWVPDDHHQNVTLSARVRNLTDGREATVVFPDQTLDPGSMAPLQFVPGTADTFVADWFARYLHNRLNTARATPTPMFIGTFGTGSEWCLVEPPAVTSRSETMEGLPAGLPVVPGMEPPLGPCPPRDPVMPSVCQNDPGDRPTLGLPNPYDFGNQPVGVDSGWRPVVLTNTGSGRLCLALPSLSPGADFFVEAGTCAYDPADPDEGPSARRLLAPGASCTLNVRLQPQRPGLHMTTLPIVSNDPDPTGPWLELRGFGVGGTLSVSAIDAPGAIRDPGGAGGPATVCIAPYGADPTHYRPYILIRNDGAGIVSLAALPSDAAWTPLFDFYIIDTAGALRRPTGAEAPPNVPTLPVVLGVGEQLRFGGVADVSATTPTGRLVFSGNQQNNPFTISVVPSTACP